METVLNTGNISISEKNRTRIILQKFDTKKEKIPLDNISLKTIKRVLDVTLSLTIILCVLSWMIPLFGIIIKISSRGPVFFLQKRNGLNGRPFICIKFRTMFANEESDITPTCEGDKRITRPGKFLRRYCLDEFPQFFNVVTGRMAIVGPRPHMILENSKYEKLLDGYAFRYRIKPGITGLAQVKYRKGRTPLETMEERILWDLHYIRNWSLFMDIMVLYRTLIFIFNN